MLLNIFLAILLQYTDGLGDDEMDYATYKAQMRAKRINKKREVSPNDSNYLLVKKT
jgi:hypothetical protein